MTFSAPGEAIMGCPLCGQQFRRAICNGIVSYFDADADNDYGSRCPFGDQSRTPNRTAEPVSAPRPQCSPDGCLKDLVIRIHELHQLERRDYDGGMLAHADCATSHTTGMCTSATPASISKSRQPFVTISAPLATFMQHRNDPEHKCPACGHACCEPTRGSCGLCADCVASGLTG